MTAGQDRLVRQLLDRHGTTFGEQVGIDPRANKPAALFGQLCVALPASARISADIAQAAAHALREHGWNSARAMAESSWDARAKTLNQAGYARYDERTATMLGQTAELLMERYSGDLRRLREAAGRDPDEERALLKEFKGIGDVGVDVFFREVQGAWDELYPFIDRRAAEGAQALGLPTEAGDLAGLVPKTRFPQLAAALVRSKLAHDAADIRHAAN